MPSAMTGLATSAPSAPTPCSGKVQPTPSCATFADEMVECATRVLYRSPLGEGHSLAKRTFSGGAPGGGGGVSPASGGAHPDSTKQAANVSTRMAPGPR